MFYLILISPLPFSPPQAEDDGFDPRGRATPKKFALDGFTVSSLKPVDKM